MTDVILETRIHRSLTKSSILRSSVWRWQGF